MDGIPSAAAVLLSFLEGNLHILTLAVPFDGKRYGVPDLMVVQCGCQVTIVLNWLAIQSHDDVANVNPTPVGTHAFQPGLRCGAAGHDFQNYGSVVYTELAGLLVLGQLDAEGGTNDFAMPDQFRYDLIDLIHRDRETDAGECPGRTQDGRIHSDQPAGAVEQRAAGVPRIDRCARLDYPADRPLIDGLDLATQGADDAGGHGLIQAKGITQGVGNLPHLQIMRSANRDRPELALGGLDGEHGNIHIRIDPGPGPRAWNDRIGSRARHRHPPPHGNW